MNRKTIAKMAVGAGIASLAGAITYRLIKDHRDKKYIENMEDEFECSIDDTVLTHEDMLLARRYVKLPYGKNNRESK